MSGASEKHISKLEDKVSDMVVAAKKAKKAHENPKDDLKFLKSAKGMKDLVSECLNDCGSK